jgi:hypothetical protein
MLGARLEVAVSWLSDIQPELVMECVLAAVASLVYDDAVNTKPARE